MLMQVFKERVFQKKIWNTPIKVKNLDYEAQTINL